MATIARGQGLTRASKIVTAADALNGKAVEMPPQVSPFAQAPREQVRDGEQAEWEI